MANFNSQNRGKVVSLTNRKSSNDRVKTLTYINTILLLGLYPLIIWLFWKGF